MRIIIIIIIVKEEKHEHARKIAGSNPSFWGCQGVCVTIWRIFDPLKSRSIIDMFMFDFGTAFNEKKYGKVSKFGKGKLN